MHAKWLYCSADETWHLWPMSEPVEGDLAYCGKECDEECTVGGEGITKCEACLVATQTP